MIRLGSCHGQGQELLLNSDVDYYFFQSIGTDFLVLTFFLHGTSEH